MIRYIRLAEQVQQPLPAKPFHEIEFPDGTLWTEFHRRGTAYLLRFPGYADFDVSADGTDVASYPVPGHDPVTLEHLYNHQVLPLALSRQGRMAYHGSAVTVAHGAIAFLGATGQGKSTLAAQFATTGERFLTDDGLHLRETPEGLVVEPNHPSIRLWNDSREAVLTKELRLAPSVSYNSKSRVLAGDALPYCDAPSRLLAAFVLGHEGTPDVVIRRASGVDAVLGWIGHSFLLDVEDQTLLLQHFENATRVAAAVPTFHLDYPRRYDRLADVQAAILEHLKS